MRVLAGILIFLVAPSMNADPRDEAAELLSVMELVARHHVQPPARQQMVLEMTRNIYRAANLAEPARLSEQVSGLSDRDEFAGFISYALGRLRPDQVEEVTRQARDMTIRALPGDCRTVRAKDYNVEQQLAGNRYVGVGIRLSDAEGAPVISQVVPGGPMDGVGGERGDRIWLIDGEDMRKEPLREVIDRLRGPEGTEVVLGLMRKRTGRLDAVRVTRDVVPLKAIGQREIGAGAGLPVAYARPVALQSSLPHELRKMERWLEEKRALGLILDLRGLSGGRIHDVKLLLDTLLPGGRIGAVDGEEFQAGPDAILSGVELAVLVDQTTRGPAEWLAGSLQANGRAMVVGDVTAGEPYGEQGFALAGTGMVLVIPNRVLALGKDESLSYAGSENPKAFPLRVAGVEPDLRVDGDFRAAALKSGMKLDEVMIHEAAEALRKRIGKPAA